MRREDSPAAAPVISDGSTTALVEVDEDTYSIYGVRKVHAELYRQGHPVRAAPTRGCRARPGYAISRAKSPGTTTQGTGAVTRPNLIGHTFQADASDRL